MWWFPKLSRRRGLSVRYIGCSGECNLWLAGKLGAGPAYANTPRPCYAGGSCNGYARSHPLALVDLGRFRALFITPRSPLIFPCSICRTDAAREVNSLQRNRTHVL
ncbi:hypothetical protein JG687_00014440 [Phytophthora cactorum]|uniref:Uncharacterized protein n=1 Tax=Phytophthora cactorum TaxID=29920 RepID=A0A8T1TYR5_9STRA|nr:hypothetical protein JG687_00014440 [Phytophthora cactorum]